MAHHNPTPIQLPETGVGAQSGNSEGATCAVGMSTVGARRWECMPMLVLRARVLVLVQLVCMLTLVLAMAMQVRST